MDQKDFVYSSFLFLIDKKSLKFILQLIDLQKKSNNKKKLNFDLEFENEASNKIFQIVTRLCIKLTFIGKISTHKMRNRQIIFNNTQLNLQFNPKQYPNNMQPPQTPIDINIELGSDQGAHNLIKVDIEFSENKEQINSLKKNKKINLTLSNSFVLIFDLYTEPGRQKQAIEYINQQSQKGLSPLQIVFSNKPSPQSDFCKLNIEAHEGFIRLTYQFFPQQNQLNAINSVLQSFSTNGLKLQSQINIQLKGKLTHTNNNRTNVLVDYSKFHLVSNAFCSQKLISCLLEWDDFQNNCHYYIQSPFFQLIKKSKVAKMNLKMDSFRKISKYYGKVAHTKQPQVKQFKYINKGIFRQKAEFIFIYSDEYLINTQADYESQDAFIRLVKVYSKFIENTLDVKFYKYD